MTVMTSPALADPPKVGALRKPKVAGGDPAQQVWAVPGLVKIGDFVGLIATVV